MNEKSGHYLRDNGTEATVQSFIEDIQDFHWKADFIKFCQLGSDITDLRDEGGRNCLRDVKSRTSVARKIRQDLKILILSVGDIMQISIRKSDMKNLQTSARAEPTAFAF